MPLSADHVGALNLVEIEFHGYQQILTALKALMDHFETGYGTNKTLEELKAANQRADILRTTLLSNIARALRYNFEQIDIFKGGYAPQGWGAELDDQTTVRKGMADILSGRRPFPITVVTVANPVENVKKDSPFPPKPE